MISVVIPIGGEWYLPRLENCLRSVRFQTLKADEVIIAYVHKLDEDVPREELYEITQDDLLSIREYDLPGFPTALSRNIGIKRASGNIIITVDADTYLHPKTLEVCNLILRRSKCFVRIKTRMMPYEPENKVFQIKNEKEYVKRSSEGKWAPGPGCVIASTKKAMNDIGGWDERFYGYGPVVLDVCARLRKAGYKEAVLPNAFKRSHVCCMHQHHERVRDQQMSDLRKRNIRYYENTLKKTTEPLRNKKGWGL
jgi:GT2 family glycosyltransferase